MRRLNPGRPRFREITFGADGTTGNMFWIWSGEMLMDLERNQTLKMTPKTIANEDYLLVEAGGFSTRNPPGWKPALYVLRRQAKITDNL